MHASVFMTVGQVAMLITESTAPCDCSQRHLRPHRENYSAVATSFEADKIGAVSFYCTDVSHLH
jgi:hypothetical protein